jgi:hypothetical protein
MIGNKLLEEHFMPTIKINSVKTPWQHWLADHFLTPACLGELKAVKHEEFQQVAGRRVGNQRLFITNEHKSTYPHLHSLYCSLYNGPYKEFFEQHTGQDYTNLFPRLEVISDIGPFYLEPHHDHLEKRLTAIVYTDYQQLYPGTELSNGSRVEARDNRCFFFVPATDTVHGYPATTFHQVRRCLQINYWTYDVPR